MPRGVECSIWQAASRCWLSLDSPSGERDPAVREAMAARAGHPVRRRQPVVPGVTAGGCRAAGCRGLRLRIHHPRERGAALFPAGIFRGTVERETGRPGDCDGAGRRLQPTLWRERPDPGDHDRRRRRGSVDRDRPNERRRRLQLTALTYRPGPPSERLPSRRCPSTSTGAMTPAGTTGLRVPERPSLLNGCRA